MQDFVLGRLAFVWLTLLRPLQKTFPSLSSCSLPSPFIFLTSVWCANQIKPKALFMLGKSFTTEQQSRSILSSYLLGVFVSLFSFFLLEMGTYCVVCYSIGTL